MAGSLYPSIQPNRDLRVGRLLLVTAEKGVGEAVGEDITSEETGVAVARHRAKKFTLVFPLYGSSADANPYVSGERMRRQMRAIMENSIYRQQGLYLQFAVDPELNGWMMFGSGTITYADGGVSLGQFQIEYDSAFRIGSMRTDRAARRIELYDRTTLNVFKDFKSIVTGTDFFGLRDATSGPYGTNTNAAGAAAPVVPMALPVNVKDPLSAYRAPVVPGSRPGLDGPQMFATGLQHGQVVSFEQNVSDQNKGDVLLFDRQGVGGETFVPQNGVLSPNFSNGNAGLWSVFGGGGSAVAQALVADTSFASGQANQITVSGTATGASLAYMFYTDAAYNGVTCAPGDVLTVRCKVRVTTAFSAAFAGLNLTLGVRWHPTPGAAVSTTAFPAASSIHIDTLTVGTVYELVATVTVPANTGWATPELTLNTPASGTLSGVLNYSDVMIAKNPAGQAAALPYFDGTTPGYRWDGPAGLSTSSGPWMLVNLAPNPSFEYDAVGVTPAGWANTQGYWLNAGASIPVTRAQVFNGAQVMQVITTAVQYEGCVSQLAGPFQIGQPYTLSLYLRGNAGGESVQIALGTTSADSASSTVVLTPTWTRYTVTWTPTAVEQIVFVVMRQTSTLAQSWFVDAVQVERGTTASAYFDGDQQYASWVGTPGNSQSAAFTPTLGQDVQAFNGWEEIYGPDQTLTAGDAAVLQNAHCRVRYVAATNSWAVDVADPGNGWSEQGRVTVHESYANDVYPQHKYAIPQNDGALASVVEWTPERCVLRFSTLVSAISTASRIDTYISLQRGWLGPRFESYVTGLAGQTPGGLLRWTPNTTAAVTAVTPTAGGYISTDDPLFGFTQTQPQSTFGTLGEPWVYLQPVASAVNVIGTTLCTTQIAARVHSLLDNSAYGGSNRACYGIAARYNEGQTTQGVLYGYVTMAIAFNTPGPVSVIYAKDYNYTAASNPLVAQSSPSTAATGGSIAPGTYYLKITALGASGETLPSSEQSIVVPAGTSTNTITANWGTTANASGYNVYIGTAAGGENSYFAAGNVNSLVLTSSSGTAGTPPAASTFTTNADVSDAASLGGTVVKETQTTELANTVRLSTPTTMPLGKYGVWARVRAGVAGTYFIRGGFQQAGNTACVSPTGSTLTFANTTYAWVYLGDGVLGAHATADFFINLYGPNKDARVDRIVFAPVERRLATNLALDGARDWAGLHLWDARAIPEYQER